MKAIIEALSDKLPIINGVKQGKNSALTLFTIYFAVVFLVAFSEKPDVIYIIYRTSCKVYNIRRLSAHKKVSFSPVRELLYVDDFDIVTHSEDEMQRIINRFALACKSFDLEINLKNTFIMYDPVSGFPHIEQVIYDEGKKNKRLYTLL